MNISREPFENNLHFPLKVTDLPNGEVSIKCPVMPEREWIGPNLQVTLRKAQDDLRTSQDDKKINTLPTCFLDGTFSGVIVRE